MPDKKFDLGDYVEVKDRIRVFYELFGNGRLVTSRVFTELGPDGKGRVLVEAKAYRNPDDPLPGVGWSWMELPGTTSYTKGSELENTETSAWGRAIGSLGILIDHSIASQNEIANKEDEAPHDGSLIGIAEVAKPPYDFQIRETPDGSVVGFGLKEGRQIVRVMAQGPLALLVAGLQAEIVGQRVTTYGDVVPDTFVVNKGKPNERAIPYLRQTLTRIQTPAGMIPATEAQGRADTAATTTDDELAPEAAGSSSGESAANPPTLTPDQEAEIDALPLFQDNAA